MQTLIFPTLNPLGAKDKQNGKQMYQLNWANKAARCPKAGQELPDDLRFDMDSQSFSIDDKYMGEIERTRGMALCERCIPRPFDTPIRDMLAKPSHAFIECHFNLIADCVKTPARHTRTRIFDHQVLSRLMLYRFWQFQTGVGLPWFLSGFDELQNDIDRHGPRILASVQDITREMYEHHSELVHEAAASVMAHAEGMKN